MCRLRFLVVAHWQLAQQSACTYYVFYEHSYVIQVYAFCVVSNQALRLPDLDPILGPVAARHRSSTPRSIPLALMCRAAGSTPPIPAASVRAWITSRLASTRPDVVELANSTAWSSLVALARERVAETASETGRHQLAVSVARRLVGRLLAASPDGGAAGARAVGARVALAVVGVRALANLTDPDSPAAGIDAPRLSADDLAVTAGVQRQAATGWMRLAVTDLGLKRVGGPQAGQAPAWRIEQCRGASVHAADDHREVTAGLADGSSDDPVAVAIRSVDHPTWGHTGLGHAAWLVFVADLAGIDPTTLGMARSTPARARAALRTAGIDDDAVRSEPTSLPDRLDRLARTVGTDGRTAMDRFAAAGAARAVRKADRIASVQSARAVTDSIQAARRSLRTEWAHHETARATVRLPDRFDPIRSVDRLAAKLAAAGLELDSVDTDGGTATVRLGADLAERERAADAARRTKRSDRARRAARRADRSRRTVHAASQPNRTTVPPATTTEQATVPLPPGFDADQDMDRLAGVVAHRLGHEWTVHHVDVDRGVAVVRRTTVAA